MATAPVTPRLSVAAKARLVVEVLREYVPALRTLRTNDLPRMIASARAVPATKTPEPGDTYWVSRRLAGATSQILQLLPSDSRCLIRSLVVMRLMTRRSLQATLVIGVQPGPGFGAHAWIEHHGRPVLPVGNHQRLTEF